MMLEILEAMRPVGEPCAPVAAAPEVVGIDVAGGPDATVVAVAAPAETPPWLRYREEFGKR